MRTLSRCLLTTAFVLLSLGGMYAQVSDPALGSGVVPYQTYLGEKENINLGTGNVNLQIPLLKLPGRNGHDVSIGLTYNSQVWSLHSFTNPTGQTTYTWYAGSTGWQWNRPTLTNDANVPPYTSTSQYSCNGNYRLKLWDGRVIYFPYVYNDCYWHNPNGQIVASPAVENLVGSEGLPFGNSYGCAPDFAVLTVSDGNSPSKVTLRSGETLWFPAIYGGPSYLTQDEDSNGNIITYSDNGNGLVITDTVGRSITIVGGTNGTVPSSISYKDSNGTYQTINVTFQDVTVNTNFPTNLYGEENQAYTWILPASIVLPNGDEWDMQYGPDATGYTYGELTKITYPTGGFTSYEYEFAGTAQGDNSGATSMRQVYAKQACRDYNSRSEGGSCSSLDTTTITPTPTGGWYTNASSQVIDAVGDKSVYTFAGIGFLAGYETTRQLYSGASTLLRTVATTPTCNGPTQETVTLDTYNGVQLVSKKIVPADIPPNTFYGYQTTVPGSNTVTTAQEYDYGNGQAGTLLRQTRTTWMAINPVNGVNYTSSSINVLGKKLSEVVEDGNGNTIAQTQYEYDNYSSTAPHAALKGSGATQLDPAYVATAGYTTRGNLTATQRWVNTTNTWLPTTNTFDDAGNVLTTTDPKSNTAKFSYADSWGDTHCVPISGNAATYVTSVTNALSQVTRHTYNSCTGTLASTTDANLQVTTYTASNGPAAYDVLGRLTQTNFPDGGQVSTCYSDNPSGPGSGCTASNPQLSTTQTTLITSGISRINVGLMDGTGNVVRTELTSDPTGTDYVDTVYDGLERKLSVSNPYRSTSDPTYGLTYFEYDGLNRTTLVTEQDGSKVITDYAGNTATVTDEAGNQRRSVTDGLGRLTEVDEPSTNSASASASATITIGGLSAPLVTKYRYDTLNNLICAVQQATDTTQFTTCAAASATWRPRSFVYDSLSRLTSATNPESGTITYSYDADGNVLTKTAMSPNQGSTGTAQVTTTYTYDTLNRLTGKSYQDAYTSNPPTARVAYGYDGVALTGCSPAPPGDTDSYPAGRRTAMCDGSGATSWVHDKMGRTKQERRIIGAAAAKYVTYVFNLDGSLATLTTPPMKTVTYTYSRAARATKLVDSGDSINFVTNATYAPHGALTGLSNGSAGLSVTNTFNKRLQPVLLSATSSSGTVMSLCYDFHMLGGINQAPCVFSGTSPGDNGNVYKVVNNRDGNRTQIFAYDSLNRVLSGQSSGSGSISWGENYTIDAWSNLYTRSGVSGKTNTEPLSCLAGTNNQLTTCSYGYDPAGNMTRNGTIASYTYDAENRVVWTSGYRYIYDGNGERVEKCLATNASTACPTSGTNGTLYWRGTGSDTLDESDLSGNPEEEYIYFNGNRVSRRDVSSTGATIAVHYYFSDHLGSTSLVTDALGTLSTCGSYTVPTGEDESDYYPYGGEMVLCNRVPQNYKFTGKERDSESGLDEFGARYYASSLGRFMIPDWAGKPTAVPYASFGNPQSLNLYSYVNNNPTTTVDPDGHCPDGICENISALTPEQVDQRASDNTQAGIGVLKGVINFATSSMNAFITMGESTSGPIPQMSPSNDAQAVGMMVGTAGMGVASLGAEAPVASTIEQNAARGSAFEQSVKSSLQSQQTGVVEQLTVKTESGVKTRIDFAGKEAGKTALTEAKSSATAPLTKAQTKAFPEIQKTGCTVCGNGKPGFPGGTKIPPTKVKIIRPN